MLCQEVSIHLPCFLSQHTHECKTIFVRFFVCVFCEVCVLRRTPCFSPPTGEPIRPIDPAAWVSHTAAMTGVYPAYGMSPSMSTVTSTSSSIGSSVPETERESHTWVLSKLTQLNCI